MDVEEVLVSERSNISEKRLPKDKDRNCHPHLRDIVILEVDVKKVSVLIGKDVNYAYVLEVRKPGSEAHWSVLSWELFRKTVAPRR